MGALGLQGLSLERRLVGRDTQAHETCWEIGWGDLASNSNGQVVAETLVAPGETIRSQV
jgi:hypothetical protein